MSQPSFLYESLRELAFEDGTVYTVLAQQHETGEPDIRAAVRLIEMLASEKKRLQEYAIKTERTRLTPSAIMLDSSISTPRGKTVSRRCKRCGEEFWPRLSDVKRGWGRFCSKSCKAEYQTYGTKKA